MSNMSYCRFENTASDLSDCLAQLRGLFGDGEDRPDRIESHNDHERRARVRLVELCLEVAELFEDAADEADPRAAIKAIIEKQEAALEEHGGFEGDEDEDDGDDEGGEP